MRPRGEEAEAVALAHDPALVLDIEQHGAAEHEAGFLAMMDVVLVAGAGAGLHLDDEEVELDAFRLRGQQLLADARAPELQLAAIRLAHDGGGGVGLPLIGREELGDRSAERVGDGGEHAQRRRGQATLDLAEEADRQSGAARELFQRQPARAPEQAQPRSDLTVDMKMRQVGGRQAHRVSSLPIFMCMKIACRQDRPMLVSSCS